MSFSPPDISVVDDRISHADQGIEPLFGRFDGIPVAKLPFEPPQFMRRLSHRNLQGDDFSECSVVSARSHYLLSVGTFITQRCT